MPFIGTNVLASLTSAPPSTLEPGTVRVNKEVVQDVRDADVLTRYGYLNKAEQCWRTVINKDPAFVLAYHNLAALCDMQGKHDEVEGLYEEALKLRPFDVMLHHFYGLVLLSRGKLKQGWEHYKWRVKRASKTIPEMYGVLDLPYWQGEPLLGRHLVVWTEQGLGDEILFASMFNELIDSGCKLSIVCSPTCQYLFETSFQRADVYNRVEIREKKIQLVADFQASLVEVGTYLRPDMDSFKKSEPYLAVRNTDVWKIGEPDLLNVGISWFSTNSNVVDDKSIPLEDWITILKLPNINFISLQHGISKTEVQCFNDKYGINLIHSDDIKDFNKLAGLVEGLDLVISVSNTNVHLAAALGKSVWAIIPELRGRMWYWFTNRKDSPFYATVDLLRRQKGNDYITMYSILKKLKEYCVKQKALT